MKKLLGLCCLLLFLPGCTGKNRDMERALNFRAELLKSESCSFQSDITADYGDAIHNFSMLCKGDRQGNLTFTVTKPETISGITGTVSQNRGQLTFDETALQFDLMTDQQLSPVSAPWIFLKTLREGYLLNAGQEEDLLHISARDTYEEDALMVDIWLGAGDLPVRGEILFRNRRILTLDIQDFQLDYGG